MTERLAESEAQAATLTDGFVSDSAKNTNIRPIETRFLW